MRTKWRPMNIYCRCSSRQITDTRCTAFPRIATLAASRANVGGWRKLARGVDTSDIRFWRRAGSPERPIGGAKLSFASWKRSSASGQTFPFPTSLCSTKTGPSRPTPYKILQSSEWGESGSALPTRTPIDAWIKVAPQRIQTPRPPSEARASRREPQDRKFEKLLGTPGKLDALWTVSP